MGRGGAASFASAAPAPQTAAEAPSPIPRRWGTSRQDVLENFLAAMSATGIEQHERFAAIKERRGWRVRDVLTVSRLDGRRGYHLIEIAGAGGQPLMAASVDAEGWLVAVADTRGQVLRRPTSLDAAAASVRQRRGNVAVRRLSYVSGLSTVEPGLTEFAPLAMVERGDGIYYVNSAGAVFRQGADETAPRGVPAVSVRGRWKHLERVN
jgi:hypothetical protein